MADVDAEGKMVGWLVADLKTGRAPKDELKTEVNRQLRLYRDILRDNNHHIFVGDMNIAPHIHDVWSHNQLINVVNHTEIERKKIIEIINNNNLCDIMRHYAHEEEKVYSWWSYRNRDWRKSNRGRRLDHVWVSDNLKNFYTYHEIFTDARDFEKPSDHVPVLIEFSF